MGLTIKEMKSNLVREREVVKVMLTNMKRIRASIKQSRQTQKELRTRLKEERLFNRVVKADNLRLEREQRAAKRADRVAARIAKTEARLAELRLKASAPKTIRKNQRKASDGVVYSPEQITELNKTLGLGEG